ncbi:alanine racemase [Patescibacteria group bacterium]|nr:alanine racemase [Patescibacteria group bacterium]
MKLKAPLAWVTVDLRAIDHNIKQFRQLQKPGTKIIAVVKANAYGHGMFEVALQTLRSGADMLGVVNANEALILRKKGIIKPIVVLGVTAKDEMLELIKQKVSFAVCDQQSLNDATRVANIIRKTALLHIKIETGINRLGFIPDDVSVAIKKIKQHRWLELEGIFTHLASVEELNTSYTKAQLFQFDKVLARIAKKDIGVNWQDVPYVSAAASAAAMLVPDSRYNTIRLGIAMYGLWPSRGVEAWAKKSPKTRKIKLKPSLKYKTKLVAIKRIPAGSFVGYGSTFQAPKAMTLGVVPIGYAEGIDRNLSNMGFMLLKGAVVPIVGRVCMNMTILDISKRPKSNLGSEVIFIGQSSNKHISATDVGDWAGTINYEITTRIPEQVVRIYQK